MPLTATIKAGIKASHTAALDLGSAAFLPNLLKTIDYGNGVLADQADKLFTDQRTLAASATEDLDLAGVLTDAFGATITFARVRALYVAAAIGNTNNVQVGGAASNAFVNWVADATDKVNVRPGGVLILASRDATGYAVTAATGDLLRIGNSGSGTPVTYDIAILGCSA